MTDAEGPAPGRDGRTDPPARAAEPRRRRKRLVGIGIVGVLVLVAVAALLVPAPDVERDGEAVALIHLSGEIRGAPEEVFGAALITPDVVRNRIEQAVADPRVAAIVLRVDSPGGTVAASQEILEIISEVELPVVISMGDQVLSGGYYISIGADRLVAQQGTLTGSIGVISLLLDVSELLDEFGIGVETVISGEHKDMFMPLGVTDEQRQMIQDLSDRAHTQFIAAIAEHRELGTDEVEALATGEVFDGEQAVELGLADVVGGLEQAIVEAEDLAGIEDAPVIEVRPGFFETFFGAPGVRADPLEGWLRRPVEVDRTVEVLRELVSQHGVLRYVAP
jgi:protease IV